LLWLVSGGGHLLLYTFKVQGTERKHDSRWLSADAPKFLFRNLSQWRWEFACTKPEESIIKAQKH
jgi:hypothetical protein